MRREQLANLVSDVSTLRGIFLTAMPDCLLYDAWIRPGEAWVPESIASYFGDLMRANREGLKAMGAWSADMQVTIESAGVLLILHELRADFLVTLAFDEDTPLGLARLHATRILQGLDPLLPQVEVSERPRAIRVAEFLEKYAPDPHATLQRVALRTGLALEALKRPELLNESDVVIFEGAVEDILGLDSLSL